MVFYVANNKEENWQNKAYCSEGFHATILRGMRHFDVF